MGLVASQARKLFLTMRVSDLSFNVQQLAQKKMNLSAQMLNVGNQKSKLLNQTVMNGINQQVTAQVEAKMKQFENYEFMINQQEKMIDGKMETYKTQMKAAETELASVKKIIDSNIKRTFNYAS